MLRERIADFDFVHQWFYFFLVFTLIVCNDCHHWHVSWTAIPSSLWHDTMFKFRFKWYIEVSLICVVQTLGHSCFYTLLICQWNFLKFYSLTFSDSKHFSQVPVSLSRYFVVLQQALASGNPESPHTILPGSRLPAWPSTTPSHQPVVTE